MATSSMCNGSRSWIACWVRFSTFDSCFFFLLSPTICCARSNSFCISFRLPANARAPLSLVRSMAALFHISFNFLVLDGARGDCGTRTMNSSPSAVLAQHHFCNMLCLLFFCCLFFASSKSQIYAFLFAYSKFAVTFYIIHSFVVAMLSCVIRGRRLCRWRHQRRSLNQDRERKRKRKKCLFIIIFVVCCYIREMQIVWGIIVLS